MASRPAPAPPRPIAVPTSSSRPSASSSVERRAPAGAGEGGAAGATTGGNRPLGPSNSNGAPGAVGAPVKEVKQIKVGQYVLDKTLGVGSFGKVKRELKQVQVLQMPEPLCMLTTFNSSHPQLLFIPSQATRLP